MAEGASLFISILKNTELDYDSVYTDISLL